MRDKWLKLTAGAVLLGVVTYGWHRWQVKRHGPLGFLAKPSRFLRYAIALEAQQVPLYRQLADQADVNNERHFATGLRKAMEVEQKHLDNLSLHAPRFGVSETPWAFVGRGLGLLSGGLLSLFETRTGLKVIAAMETKAAQDYREAYNHLDDQDLKKIYLENQIDEQAHYTWAKEMLQKQRMTKRPE